MSTGKTTMHQAHRAEPARPAAPAPDADRPPQPGGRRRCARPGGLWRQERGDVPGWGWSFMPARLQGGGAARNGPGSERRPWARTSTVGGETRWWEGGGMAQRAGGLARGRKAPPGVDGEEAPPLAAERCCRTPGPAHAGTCSPACTRDGAGERGLRRQFWRAFTPEGRTRFCVCAGQGPYVWCSRRRVALKGLQNCRPLSPERARLGPGAPPCTSSGCADGPGQREAPE